MLKTALITAITAGLAITAMADVWLKNPHQTSTISGTVNGTTYTFAPGQTKAVPAESALHLYRRTRSLLTVTDAPKEVYSQAERNTVATMDATQLGTLVQHLLDSDHAAAHSYIYSQTPTPETTNTETDIQ